VSLYFSGVAGRCEAEILHRAGVTSYVVDTRDARNMPYMPIKGRVVVDSGAYRAWKSGKPLTVEGWVTSLPDDPRIEAFIMPDVIGDWPETRARWVEVSKMTLPHPVWPVWTWGAPMADLRELLDQSPVVCVGGMVKLLRDGDKRALMGLRSVATKHGDRLHILGMNSLASIDLVGPLVRSYDTSKWIDGGRYATAVLCHNGRLYDRPARSIDNWAGLDRKGRMYVWAKTLESHCNKKNEPQ
jgi:hypothetical protein